MGKMLSKISNTSKVLTGILARILFGWNKDDYTGETNTSVTSDLKLPSFFSDETLLSELRVIFNTNTLEKLSDEALIKICRQLDFWISEEKLSKEDIIQVAKMLVEQSTWYQQKDCEFKVPTRRFGKTEIDMPILTCGGMRLQNTWLPDFVPVLRPNRKHVLKSPPQENIKNCIRACLKIGMNHFETARFYGTSEYQIVEALFELMQSGEIQRSDFIFQTKIPPMNSKNFKKFWDQSWSNIGEKLGYIDLLALHAISFADEKMDESLEICNQLKNEGKIRHIGFSTHGVTPQIMDLINTEKFEYINLHYHYFGSYHGSGTSDTQGGEGNLACVKRALELDMGVFNISPIDKGGKLFRPSELCASLIGKELTPIGFALLYGWKKVGFHTASIGLARPSDLDEVLYAAKMMKNDQEGLLNVDDIINGSIERLETRSKEILGETWMQKGLLNIPNCYEECTDGIALGHILWLHNLLTCYGMYEYCRDRYTSLVAAKWDKKKSYEENKKNM